MATPNSQRIPVPLNPYQWALGVLALAALIVGLIVLVVNQPDELSGDPGSEAGRVTGVFLLGTGVVLGAGWMVASALLWKPREPVRRAPESDQGTATLDR